MFLSFIRSVLLAATLLASPAARADELPGPYLATVERVVDGDTLAGRVTVWLDLDISVLVRIRGVDAPELRGRCDLEKLRAAKAALALASLVGDGQVLISGIEGDKYFGRVLADVVTPDGRDVAEALLKGGHVRRYDGRSRASWCEIGRLDGPALAQAGAP
jgi:micrococcal nuclease